jgi:hypothetical protein
MTKLISLGAFGALSLVLVGCASAHHIANNSAVVHEPSAADAAIQTVTASAEGKHFTALFPATVGTQACVIIGGGPAPGSRVPGTCETSVGAVGSNQEVRFSERWSHWTGDGGTGEESHTWTVTVGSQGKIISQRESGNFPPQSMR